MLKSEWDRSITYLNFSEFRKTLVTMLAMISVLVWKQRGLTSIQT